MIGTIFKWGLDAVNFVYNIFTLRFLQILYAGYLMNFMYFFTWLLSLKMSDATLVDYLWGTGFAVQSVLYFSRSLKYTFLFIFSEKFSWEKFTFAFLVAAHGIRLTAYLLIRDKGKSEDKRYGKLREKMGGHFWWFSYFFIYMPQLFLNLAIGMTIYEFNNSKKKDLNHMWYWIGIITMLCGTTMQTLADIQMYNFKRDKRNEGKVLDTGLWGLCRHPNYFGDCLFWWGTYICNYAVGVRFTIFSPILMMFLVLFVTGIPPLESLQLKEKGDRYLEYIRNVPAFLPLGFFKSHAKTGISGAGGMQQQKGANENANIPNIPNIPQQKNVYDQNISERKVQ